VKLDLVELGRFIALLVVVFVVLEVLIQLVFVSCFVLMKFVSMFLFEFGLSVVCCFAGFCFMLCVDEVCLEVLFECNFTVVCCFASFVSCFGSMKFVSMFLCEFDFGVVCCFAGFVSLFALSFFWWTFDFLWLLFLLVGDFFFSC